MHIATPAAKAAKQEPARAARPVEPDQRRAPRQTRVYEALSAAGATVKQEPARAARTVDPAKRGARHKLAAERAAALLSGDGLLRLPEVLAVFPVSASTWWEGVRAGRFPQSIKVGPRCTCWRAADLRALIANAGTGEQP